MKLNSGIIKKISIIIMAGVISMSAMACGKKSANDSDKKKTVVIGLDDTFVPMGYKDENGEIVGFDVELAKEIFKRSGREVKFQPVD